MRGFVWALFIAASFALPRAAKAQFVNGSFETGDYTGWNPTLTQEPTFGTHAVLAHGTTVQAGDFVFDHLTAGTVEQQNPALPQMFFATEGSQVAVVLSNQPHVGRLFQDVVVPINATVLRWEMSWINNDVAFNPVNQFLEVSVRNPVDDSLLASLFKTTEGIDPLFQPMVPFTANLSAFAGQTVRIDFTSHFAQSNGIFALDNVRFVAGGLCGDGATDAGEDCDDAGASPTCDADCTFASCGDGTLNLARLEACDDGNTSSADACNATCGIDSDSDSIADLDEVGDTSLETPAPDTDLDTVPDYLDNDSDADGILDLHEAGDQDPMTPPVDRDNDGTPNFRDGDSDNDGVPDFIEAGDGNPVTPPFDTDGDLNPNFIDLDSDNDGVADGTDNCPLDPNPDQRDSDNNRIGDACQPPPPVMPKDTDGDGVPDLVDNCPLEPNPDQRDSDNNGIGDACQPPVSPEDTDAGAAATDAGAEDADAGPEESDAGPEDTDGDGVPDDVDNCPAQSNPDQRDVDEDGKGDACEVSALDAPVFGGGGGCAVASDGRSACGWAVWITLSLLALARRRRHAQLTSLVLLLAAWLFAAGSARAQVGVDANLNIDRFVPASDRDGILHVEWARVAPHLDWDASLSIGALLNPLVVRSAGRERALVASRMSATLTGSVGLWGWTQVSFALPFVALQKGDRVAGLDYPTVEGATLGDLRLAPKLRLLERVGGVFDLGLMVPLTIPTATSARFVGEKKPLAWPQVLASVSVKSVRMSANLGYLVRKDVRLGDAAIGDELTANVGIGYRLARFDLDAGAMLAWPATGSRRNAERTYAELLVGGSYWLSALAGIFVSVGRGMTSGIGSADFRAVVGVRLSQRRAKAAPRPTSNDAQGPATDAGPPDTDRDGIVDAEDGCPERAGTASDDALRHGCPKQAEKVVVLPDADGHVGAVEIDDGTTTTLLDEAYATAEVSAQGTAERVAATPSAAVARALAQAELALQPADLDADGVPDAADVCPGRAGVPSGDPLRNGCPASAERLIVLPDLDTHVGAVAIERGDQTVLVDQAYGAAEVGADGAVVKVESAPAEVMARAIAEYAAALPVADADADGVPDESDACPAAAGVSNTNPLRHGCPRVAEAVILVPDEDGHVGSLEIESGAGSVVIDKPFASFELGVDGKAQPATIADGALVQRNIASLASLLPHADRDGDGIIDAHDACPARPGRLHENEKLHGCPKTLERIVLLPDDDGHVGALEVGEGDDAFTLDAAYTSAEIAGDGKAVQLRTRAAAVEEDFRETFAARPDYSGARIVIYFNRRAQPTLDVTEQIEDLVADLYGRVGYSVSVVGHTDATGNERRNLRIGEARAQRVAEDLIAAGVARAQVTVSSKGSSEPAVRVDDPSIPELKNRRVEIFVTY